MSQTKAQLLGPLVGDNIDVEGDLNFDSGTFKVDPTNDRIGIKNSNPTKTLDVGGDTQVADLYYTADYPTIRPSLDLAFDKVKRLDSRVTFTRTSTATYVGADGLIKTAAANEPRFDHDPITGESLGLLIEGSRTNLITLSNNFTEGTYWTDIGNRWSSSLHSDVAPDGSTSVWKITRTSGDALLRKSGVSVSSGTTYTFSAYFKSISGSTAINMDISDLNGGTQTIYTDRWTRISFTAAAPSSSIYLDIGLENAVGNDEYLIWGAQLEAGSFPTSYIPTSGSTVTRSAEFAIMSDTAFTPWYNQSEGTVYAEFNPKLFVGSDDGGRLFRIYNTSNSGSNRIDYVVTSTGIYQPYLMFSGVQYSSGNASIAFQKNINYKICLSIKQNDFVGYINGSQSLVDNTVTLSTLNALCLGASDQGSQLQGHLKRFIYYPRRLNNSQLQNITL